MSSETIKKGFVKVTEEQRLRIREKYTREELKELWNNEERFG